MREIPFSGFHVISVWRSATSREYTRHHARPGYTLPGLPPSRGGRPSGPPAETRAFMALGSKVWPEEESGVEREGRLRVETPENCVRTLTLSAA